MPTGLSVLIAAATSASGAAIAGLKTLQIVGFALLGAALSGLNLLLTPRPDLAAPRQETRQLIRAAVAPARWVLGRARVGGLIAFYHEAESGSGEANLPPFISPSRFRKARATSSSAVSSTAIPSRSPEVARD